MRSTPLLAVAATAAIVGSAAAPVQARPVNVRIGIGDQSPAMFQHPAYRELRIRQVRYFIPFNAMSSPVERQKAEAWVRAAKASGARPFLHVSTDDLRPGFGALPTQAEYRAHVRPLVQHFVRLGARDFGAWNEANHKTQPTARRPARAAQYFRVMRTSVARVCRGCKVVALDVLDQAGAHRYIKRWMRALGRRYVRRYVKVVGIHNYSDVNRLRTTGLRSVLKAIRPARRADVWMTETGGVVQFAESFPCDESRAANRLDYLFATARRYRHRVSRVYLYNWTGADCRVRFDAGLTRSDGSLRPGYSRVRAQMSRFRR